MAKVKSAELLTRFSYSQLFVIAVLLGSVFVTVVEAQPVSRQPVDFPKPLYGPKEAVVRDVTLVSTRSIRLRKYTPAVKLNLGRTKAKLDYSKPELALSSWLSGLRAGDYEWAQSSWTKESAKQNREQDRQSGRGPAFWERVWKQSFEKASSELLTRIEMGPYVLLHFRTLIRGVQPYEQTCAFVKEGDSWKQTQDLANDMVANFWADGTLIKAAGARPWTPPTQVSATTIAYPKPAHAAAKATARSVEVQRVYSFELYEYHQPVEFKLAKGKKESQYSLPEEALAAHAAAVRAADSEWLLETLESSTKAFLSKDSDTSTIRPLSVSDSTSIRLTHRLDSGAYAIFFVETRDGDAGDWKPAHVVLTPEGESETDRAWRVTYELDQDPLLRVWRSKSTRVRLENLPPVNSGSGRSKR